jgi:hypothetical protein
MALAVCFSAPLSGAAPFLRTRRLGGGPVCHFLAVSRSTLRNGINTASFCEALSVATELAYFSSFEIGVKKTQCFGAE